MIYVSLVAYRRPEYTRRTLAALARCELFDRVVLTTCVDPSPTSTIDVVRSFETPDAVVVHNATRKGCNGNTGNTRQALGLSLERADGDPDPIFVHLEDDVVLSPDALVFAAAMLKQHGENPRVYTVGLYNRRADRRDKPPAAGDVREYRVRRGWGCWGWACTRPRLVEITSPVWRGPEYPKHFIRQLARGDRVEIQPLASRSQNIGIRGGIHHRKKRPVGYYRNVFTSRHVATCRSPVDGYVLTTNPDRADLDLAREVFE